MNTWKVIFATMVIFGAGVVTGGLLVRHATQTQLAPLPHPVAQNHPMQPAGLKLEFLRRVERELDVTKPQREQMDKIISASQERTRKLMEPISPQIREELEQTKKQVRAVLTPEQQLRFDELLKQQQRPHEQQRAREPKRPAHSSDSSSILSPTGAPAKGP